MASLHRFYTLSSYLTKIPSQISHLQLTDIDFLPGQVLHNDPADQPVYVCTFDTLTLFILNIANLLHSYYRMSEARCETGL